MEQCFKNNHNKQQTPRTLRSNILCVDMIVICRLFAIAGLYVLQRIGSTQEGNASFTLCGDYYNRELSGNKTCKLNVLMFLCNIWLMMF